MIKAGKEKNRIKRSALRTFKTNWGLLLLCMPALIAYILFHYIPMYGILLAFKHYRFDLGILRSPWVGLRNFEFLIRSGDLWMLARNTVGYNLAFIVVGLVVGVGLALLLYEISSRRSLKLFQTSMLLPNFLSWVIVGYIAFALFSTSNGLINGMLRFFGRDRLDIYTTPEYWPFILVMVNTWKGIGMGCLIYYAALMGIDSELFEAAKIDGANKWKQIRYISIPGLVPLMTMMTILSLSGIFRGDFGLFYTIPRNIGILNSVTDVVDTYLFRGIAGSGGANLQNSFEIAAAVGLIQSVVGFVMVLSTNLVIRKVSPENSLF